MDYRRAFRAAAVSFADLIARVPADKWDGPGIGAWSLRDLAGHTLSSGLRQVPEVLAAPSGEGVERASAEAYWMLAHTVPAEMLAEATAASTVDARATGLALGDDPAGVVGDLVGQATQALGRVGDDDVVVTPGGGMRVRDWLPTRTFELVVHGLDVSAAAGVEMFVAPEVLGEVAAQAARVAAANGDGVRVLRALTGRGELEAGFSIL